MIVGVGIDPALGGKKNSDGRVSGTGIAAVALDDNDAPMLLASETFVAPQSYPTIDRFLWLASSVRMFVVEQRASFVVVEDPTGFKGAFGKRSVIGGARLGGATAATAIGAQHGRRELEPGKPAYIHSLTVNDWIPSNVKHHNFKKLLESQYSFAVGLADDEVYAVGVLMAFVKRSTSYRT